MAENPFAKYAPQADLQPATSDAAPTGGNPFAKYAPAPAAPAPQPPSPMSGTLAAGQQGILQMVTGGLGDEIMAGAMTPVEMGIRAISGEDSGKGLGERIGNAYDISLANQRGQLHDAQEQHPIAYGVGALAGGLASGGLMAKGGATLMKAGMNLPTMVGAGGIEGGLYGVVNGFGRGEGGFGQRVDTAIDDAKNGAIVGGAMPILARGIGSAVSKFRDYKATTPGQRLVLDDIANEGTTPQELADKAKSLGPNGMLADTSETLRLRAEQLAQSDNPARPGVIKDLKDRNAGAEARTNALYDTAAGARPNVKETLDNFLAQRSAASSGPYETALSRPVVWDNRLQQFLDDPVMKEGLARGMKIQRLESLAAGEPFNPHDYAITDFDAAGDPIVTQVPNMRTLNVIKKGLDPMVDENRNDFGQLTEMGRALDQVRKSYLAKLDAINPDYAAARKAWGDASEVAKAFQKGRDIFKPGTHPDYFAAEVDDMSDAAKNALELGVRSAAADKMGSVRNGALSGRNLLDADNNERKIIAALGEDKARGLINGLLGEQEMAATSNQALSNSATARRMDNPFRPQTRTGDERVGIIQNALNARFGDAGKRAIQYAQDAFAARKAANLAQETGPMLTAQGPELDRVTQALIGAQNRRAAVNASNPEIERITREILTNGARGYVPLGLLGGAPGR